MRLTALIPALCCAAALILSFLCLFAGHKANFMEDYSLLTLNTSAIGQTLLSSSSGDSSLTSSIMNLIPDSISTGVTNEINDQIGELRQKIGVEDWYSMHMLNYCEGQYTPEEAANATLKESDIKKNTTECAKQRAMYKFDPTRIIEEALNKTGVDVTLKDLNWPEDIQNGIDTLNALMAAMFVLYINFLIATLAFLAIGLASALVTAVMVKGTNIINDKGKDIGLAASWGGKFLALTWAATALMLIVLLAWIVEFCIGRRQSKRQPFAKHG
jgi:hypothetical protein